MIRLAVLLLALSCNAFGQVAIHLDQVRLDEFARVVYGDILKTNYVVDNSLIKDDRRISVHLELPREGSEARRVLDGVLSGAGVSLSEQAGVVFLQPVKEGKVDEDFVYYRPRYRSVAYLLDLLAAVFPPGSFSTQRVVPTKTDQQPQMLSAPSTTPTTDKSRDTGTNALALLDKSPDALVFKGTPDTIKRFQQLIAQVDSATPELMVKAVVFEVSTDHKEQSALSLALSIVGGKSNIQLGSASPGDGSIVFKSGSLDVVYQALAMDSRFKVVSAPKLRVLSGSTARLTVGSDTPVLGHLQVDRNGNPVQSVEYKPSGVILDLKPQIREDVAELQILQQISNFIPTTTGVNNSPTLVKRELSTSVGVRSDEVLVLGGLDEDKDSQDKGGMSWLPDFLRPGGLQRTKSEILLILQAQRI